MKIFPSDTMKTMVITNHSKHQVLVLQSICESSIEFFYNLQMEERGWQNDNVERVLYFDNEIGGEIAITINLEPEKEDKSIPEDINI